MESFYCFFIDGFLFYFQKYVKLTFRNRFLFHCNVFQFSCVASCEASPVFWKIIYELTDFKLARLFNEVTIPTNFSNGIIILIHQSRMI